MIISNVSNEPLAQLRLNKKLNLKVNHTDKRLVFQIIYIYQYSKCYITLNFVCIFYLSWKSFYSKDRISILFYIYDDYKSSFIRFSNINYAN